MPVGQAGSAGSGSAARRAEPGDLTPAQVVAARRFERLAGFYQEARQVLRDAHRERDQAATRAEKAEAQLREGAGWAAGKSPEVLLHLLITREWLELRPVGMYPRLRYTVSFRLIERLAARGTRVMEDAAKLMALVTSGRPSALAGLLREPELTKGGKQRKRRDGSTAWIVQMQPATPNGLPLHYWQTANGTIQFDLVQLDRKPWR